MLNTLETYAVLPAKDLQRAKKFYQETLGMEPVEERDFGLVYRTPSGARILIYETQFAGTAQNTAIGFETSDLATEVAALRARGVQFEEYDMPGLTTEDGIVTMDDGESAAWFKDTEGNIIALSQTASVRLTQPAKAREATSTTVEQ